MAAIEYNQGYINSIVNKADCCLGVIGYNHSQAKSVGLDASCYFAKFQRLYLLRKALCSYVVDGENNCLSDEDKDKIIEELLTLSSCSDCTKVVSNLGCLTDENYCLLLDNFGYKVVI